MYFYCKYTKTTKHTRTMQKVRGVYAILCNELQSVTNMPGVPKLIGDKQQFCFLFPCILETSNVHSHRGWKCNLNVSIRFMFISQICSNRKKFQCEIKTMYVLFWFRCTKSAFIKWQFYIEMQMNDNILWFLTIAPKIALHLIFNCVSHIASICILRNMCFNYFLKGCNTLICFSFVPLHRCLPNNVR